MAALDDRPPLKGYALNKLCYSLNQADNRAAFLADQSAYCDRHGLDAEARAAVLSGDKAMLRAAGGNPYFLAKLERTLRSLTGKAWKEAPTGGGRN